MKLKLLFATILLSLFVLSAKAQVINAYAKVTNVAGSILTLSIVDESSDTFEDGEKIIIMQMQDDVIGANTANNSSFGDLSDIQNAGYYEIVTISTHTESAGIPSTITIVETLSATFNTGANSSVQIISFPTLGSPDYITTANISALNWDGDIGGVVAFNVAGVLTLAHNISADAAGFRGGNANADGNSAACTEGTFRTTSQDNFADKGEGRRCPCRRRGSETDI